MKKEHHGRSQGTSPKTSAGISPENNAHNLDNLNLDIYSVDSQFCYTAYSRAHGARMVSQYGVEPRIGQDATSLITDAADRADLTQALGRALGGQEFEETAEAGEDHNAGIRFNVRYIPERSSAGAVTGVCVLTRQIKGAPTRTAKTAGAADAGLPVENCLDNLFEQMRCSILVIDPLTTAILDANPAACGFYGLARIELAGLRLRDLVHGLPEDIPSLLENGACGPVAPLAATHHRADGRRLEMEVFLDPLNFRGGQACVVVAIDVTRRREEEERAVILGKLLSNVHEAVVAMDSEMKFTYFNNAAELLFGWSAAEVLGQFSGEIIPADFLENSLDGAMKTLQESGHFEGVMSFRRKDGSVFEGIIRVTALTSPAGEFKGIVTSIRDVTAQRQAEQALKDGQVLLRSILDSIPSLIWSSTPQEQDDYLNKAWLDYTGMTMEEALGSGWVNAVHPDDISVSSRKWEEAARTHSYEVELRLRGKDGLYRWFLAQAKPILDADGDVVRWFGANTDIQRLKQAEASVNMLFDTALDGIMFSKADHSILSANPAALAMLGYSRDEIIGMSRESLLDPTDPRNRLAVETKDRTGKFIGVVIFIRKDGTKLPVELSSQVFTDEQGATLTGIFMRDISDRIKYEDALTVSQDLLNKLTARLPGMVFQLVRRPDGSYCVPYASDAIVEMFGCTQEEVQHDISPITRAVLPEDRQILMDALQKSANTMDEVMCEFRVLTRGRPVRWIWTNSVPEMQPDGSIIWYGYNSDISEIRQAQAAIRENEENLRLFLTTAMDGILLSNPDGEIYAANPAVERMTGWTEAEMQALGRDGVIDQTDPRLRAALQERARQGYFRGELTFLRKDGSSFPVEVSSSIFKDAYGKTRSSMYIHDITELKRNHRIISETLEFNQRILQASPIGMIIYDDKGNCIDSNAAAERILGGKTSLLVEKNYHHSKAWKILGFEEAARQALETNQPVAVRSHIAGAAQGKLWLNATFMAFKSQELTHLLLMVEDDTERQRSEDNLRQTNETLIHLVESLEEARRCADTLQQMGELMHVAVRQDEAYHILRQYGEKLFPGSTGGLYLVNEDTRTAELMAGWGGISSSDTAFHSSDCWVLRRGQIHQVGGSSHNLVCAHIEKPFKGCYVELPLPASEEIVGMLHIEWPACAGITEQQLDLARTLTDRYSMWLANINLRSILRDQSVRDPLTGLYNRRFMEESLGRELPRALRKETTVSVIMLDIDHLKKVNDSCGHAAGDAVLVCLAKLLKEHVRGEDIVCRMGGEEFLMLMPDTPAGVAIQRAKSICTAMAAQKIQFEGRNINTVTVSIGVSVFPEHGMTAFEVLNAADKALYRAKNAGRNRVELFG